MKPPRPTPSPAVPAPQDTIDVIGGGHVRAAADGAAPAAETGLPEEFTHPPAARSPGAGHDTQASRPPGRASTSTLAAAIARLGGTPARPERGLFRVVEIGRDGDGRIARHGQIWHRDLDHVRRFGRALASNSAADRVVVADSSGAVLETIAAPVAGAPVAGWGGWRDQPLPPLPAGRRPRALPLPAPAGAHPAMTPAPSAKAAHAALEAALDAGLHAPTAGRGRPAGALAQAASGAAASAVTPAANPAANPTAEPASGPGAVPASPHRAAPPVDLPSLDMESAVERTRTLLP